jgi:16S rRNA (uracil1498-N3)-methyltransferase
MHRILVTQTIPDTGQVIAISGEEAAHAVRVKRLEPGDTLELLDGAGIIAAAEVRAIGRGSKRDGPTLEARITQRQEVLPAVPSLEVYTATPKGGRVDEMIDQLSQVGAATWGPLETARGIVEPRERKLERLERLTHEAAKQCGRAWLLRIERPATLSGLLAGKDCRVILADASGIPYDPATVRGVPRVRLLIGPEGGWTAEELDLARSLGAAIARFGPHTMRIETAAVAAAAVVMAGSPGERLPSNDGPPTRTGT